MKRTRSPVYSPAFRWLVAGIAAICLLGGFLLIGAHRSSTTSQDAQTSSKVGCSQVDRIYQNRGSNQWLTLSAKVTRLLADEHGTLTHQRFIVSCPSGMTVLIVNDVSIGRRVPVRMGDRVVVRGQYVWDQMGGLVHFTHHADRGGPGGWIYVSGKLYASRFLPKGHRALSPRLASAREQTAYGLTA